MLELAFEGYFQLRMATDPDPTEEPRGVSGYTFALPGEPDFDGILHLQADEPGAWPRQYGPTPESPGPRIGVSVTRAAWNGAPLPSLVGARLRMPGARLVERNGLVVRNDFFAIDPLRIQVDLGCVTILDRIDWLDPKDPTRPIWKATAEMLERRQPRTQTRNSEEVARATGLPDASDATLIENRKQRREALVAWLERVGPSDPELAEGLRTRIAQLEILRQWWNVAEPGPPIDRRAYTLALQMAGWDTPVFGPVEANRVGADPTQPWPFRFWLGGWDGDALAAYMKGTWQIPVTADEPPEF